MRTSGRTTARLTAASAALVALVLTQTPGAATAPSSPDPERRRIGSSLHLASAEPRKHAKPTKRAAVTVSDFDGDGVDDLAVAGSGPGWTHDGHVVDGAVAVRYSSLQRRDVFAGITEATRSGCAGSFASALATGDFDRDGYDDLAVGSTCESPDGSYAKRNSGAVFVFPGSRTGLTLATARRLSRSTAGVPGRATPGERFGEVLAAGDLDGDGYDDLAVGMPRATVGSAKRAGKVAVLFGGRSGLSGEGAQAFDRSTAGVPGKARGEDRLGTSLSIGRVTSDGYRDLVVGAPGHSWAYGREGAVLLVPGSARGLAVGSTRMAGSTRVGQALSADARAPHLEQLGAAVLAADVDGDGVDEVLVGAPDSWVDRVPRARSSEQSGVVVVLDVPGSTFAFDDVTWVDLASADVPGHPEYGDAFGASLAATDLDDDGRLDVAIGAPGRAVAGQVRAGAVYVLKGSRSGLTGVGSVALTQLSPGVDGYPGGGDRFGGAVAFLDVDGAGRRDLVVGADHDHAQGDRPGNRSGSVTIFRTVSGVLKPGSSWGGVDAGVNVPDRWMSRFGGRIGHHG